MADKVLILYASAGHGHEKAARAVEIACRETGCSVECVDVLSKTSAGFGARYRESYLFMIRAVPWLWGFVYYLTDLPFIYWFVRPVRRLVNHVCVGGVEKLVAEGSWDAVISTHFMGTEVSGYLKQKGKTTARLVTVVTDYLAHSFWISDQADVFCVGSEETAKDLERRGVNAGKIRVTGIPIEAKFYTAPSREAARAALGLERGLFTILLTSGGAGVGFVEKLVDYLVIWEPPLQLLVVCGTNEAMRARLQSKHRERKDLRVFGFVDHIHELMAASNLVVGKAGGLTVTESLALGKPMVLVGAVPGQETRNVRVLVRRGAASGARNHLTASLLVRRYAQDAAFYEKALAAIESMRRAQAARAVLDAARKPS